ncbi:MAG: hypothetical protein A3H71_01805 [Candidatus Sungbacteria bacterium RIFCSPLOWO2_02_FULL_48_13b]|uniref:Glycosyltransferase RgtA/B/C/D-like domain-containing protein n=2 Tax=Candidatus Sungiibacteriota TaxID=1817917 RepID=A0A1G2LHJ3_9BACT|nr:MAG: hypothetical protein A3C12_01270 [Candidatus Sungbacteria bacterium RIFCSPHIGHO2_02_FULL_49_20]OHA10302.1 MAG: hypothetical protein A3H71_01805 [Candidatus Sungbacteria bacterium RIFCSPLOWO2_02_FULL_48_13b]
MVQLAVFALVYAVTSAKQLPFPSLTGDSNHYRILAENLLQKKAFDTFPNMYSPESFRTPGYPAFLAVLHLFFRKWVIVALFQALLMTLVPVLSYILATRLFGSTVGLITGLLVAFDPIRLFYSTITLSDTFFSLLFIWSLLLLVPRGEASTLKRLGFAGVLLGIAILVRPIGQFLPIIFLSYLFLAKVSWHQFAKEAVVFLFGVLIIVTPWAMRNKVTFDSWQLSSVGSFNAAYFTMLYLKETTGANPDSLQHQIVQRVGSDDLGLLRSVAGGELSLAFARSVVVEHPLGYLWFHAVKTIPFFLSDGIRDSARLLGIYNPALPNFSGMLLHGQFKDFLSALWGDGVSLMMLLLGGGSMALAILLGIVGFVRGLLGKVTKMPTVFFTVLILYFAVLTGPVANARYRIPVMPLLAILAGVGAQVVWRGLKRRGLYP